MEKEAIICLRKIVGFYAKSFYDPEELESIGYEIIGKVFKKIRKGEIKNWKGYLCISLCNAFRNHIRNVKRAEEKIQLYRKKQPQVSLYIEPKPRMKLKEAYIVVENGRIGIEITTKKGVFFLKTMCSLEDFKKFYKGEKNGEN